MKFKILALKNQLVPLFFFVLCYSFSQTSDDGKIDFTLLQLNDVYEIAPLDHGLVGGLARVARVRKKLIAENPNTYTVLAGDFLYPSALGTIKYNGTAMNGRQMVDVLNAMGLDLVTFGNHEFDIPESELINRINESKFDWISANVHHLVNGNAFPFTKLDRFEENDLAEQKVLLFKDADGTTVHVGLFGICINSNPKAFVQYEDYVNAASRAIASLKQRCDILIGLTHLSIEDDKKLAAKFPEIHLILGGHEHVHSYDTVGMCRIAKADANAKTVYIHRLQYNKTTKSLSINSSLLTIDQSIADDPETQIKVDQWTGIGQQSLRQQGFDPDQVIATIDQPLDGRETSVRYKATSLTELIARSFSVAAIGADATLYNSGSIRIDDVLQGVITQYDVVRTLPYGGKLFILDVKGANIQKAMEFAVNAKGSGSYPQVDRISRDAKGRWFIGKEVILPDKTYRLVINDYLVDVSKEFKPFFGRGSDGVISVQEPTVGNTAWMDLRQAVIQYVRQGGR